MSISPCVNLDRLRRPGPAGMAAPAAFRLRRGAVLLEIMVALAIFVGAGAVVLGSVININRSLAASRDRQVAIDIARSKMAELEAGITTAERLNDQFVSRLVEPLDTRGDVDSMAAFGEDGGEVSGDFPGFGVSRDEAARSAVRTFDADDGFDLEAAAGGDPAATRWRVEVSTEASRFETLSVVTIRVFDTQAGDDPDVGVEVYVLRQLVRLSGSDEDTEYERDEIVEDPGPARTGFGGAAGRDGGRSDEGPADEEGGESRSRGARGRGGR